MKKLLITSFYLFCVITAYSQKVDLKLNLEEGKSYKQISKANATIIQDLNGQKMEMVIVIYGEMSYLVKSKSRGYYYDMEVQYDRLKMDMQMPQGTMTFDSESDNEQDIFSSIMSTMKNKAFGVRMSEKGKIEEISNVDILFENMFAKFPELPEAQQTQIKKQMIDAYGEKAFKGNIEMITSMFPEHKVAVGDTWNVETKLESGMAAKVESTFELIESTKDHNLIRGEALMATEDKDAYIETNGMPLKYNLSGTMNSEITIDAQSGWIIEAKINQNLAGNTSIKDNPQIPGGMTIPMEMQSEIVVTDK
jgi:hypothetical protein